ncbi:MAG TPA: methyl-accepting chemotaxis protein [Ktedonobacterales bacterium]|nr:methyl-accepting chemotaxis protein [Ktedonobacterales bacterium]
MGSRFSFASLPIAQRLGIGFALAGLFAVIIALAVGLANSATFQETENSFSQALKGSQSLSQIRFDLEAIQTTLTDRLAFGASLGSPALAPQVQTLSSDLDQHINDYLAAVGQGIPELVNFEQDWINYRQIALNNALLLDSRQPEDVSQAQTNLNGLGQSTYDSSINDLDALVQLTQQQVDAANARASQSNAQAFWGALGLALAGFFAVMFLAWFTVHSITHQLDRLLRLTRQVNQGNLNERVSIEGHNEIALVASSMNDMLDTIGKLLEKEESLRIELEEQIELLIHEVTPVGQGDLRLQAIVTHSQLGMLADVFNLIVEQLAALVARVQSSASLTYTAADSIVQQATDLAKVAEQQAGQLGQANDGMGKLATAAADVARLARTSAVTATETVTSARRGSQAALQVLDRVKYSADLMTTIESQMQVLGNHSKEISAVVSLIEGIAKQTQLLSLNAEVQAGQSSGDFNRGFGVVAEEIRRLAERTEDAVHQITMLVRTVQGDIYGVIMTSEQTAREFNSLAQLTDEASRALQLIWTGVAQQAKDIEAITQVAAWQESVASAAAGMIRSLAAMAKGMGEIAHGQEASARNLSEISQSLQSSITAFRLPAQLRSDLLPGQQPSGQLLLPQVQRHTGPR